MYYIQATCSVPDFQEAYRSITLSSLTFGPFNSTHEANAALLSLEAQAQGDNWTFSLNKLFHPITHADLLKDYGRESKEEL